MSDQRDDLIALVRHMRAGADYDPNEYGGLVTWWSAHFLAYEPLPADVQDVMQKGFVNQGGYINLYGYGGGMGPYGGATLMQPGKSVNLYKGALKGYAGPAGNDFPGAKQPPPSVLVLPDTFIGPPAPGETFSGRVGLPPGVYAADTPIQTNTVVPAISTTPKPPSGSPASTKPAAAPADGGHAPSDETDEEKKAKIGAGLLVAGLVVVAAIILILSRRRTPT